MKNTSTLNIQIGEIVTWTIGKYEREGIWMKPYDENHDVVMCIRVGKNIIAMQCNVPRQLLQKQQNGKN